MARVHTILTAADERFARTLWQMLASAERHGLHEMHRAMVIDLGLSPRSRASIAQRFPWCDQTVFDPAACPPHVARLSTFAWKPIVIAEAAEAAERQTRGQTRGLSPLLLWFDSGTVFHGALAPMIETVRTAGIFSLAGQTPLGRCCDERTLVTLGATEADRHEPYRAGGVLGFDPANALVMDILRRWRAAAVDPDCIAPPGHDPQTHRYDQAILTALLCAARRERGLVIGRDEIDISSINPVTFVSTRNKIPGWLPTALDPAARAFYAAWKRADRAVRRLKARGQRRASSYPREYSR